MRDRVTRAIVATAFLASLFVPVRAGAAILPDQDVSVGTLINASHDGRVAGATERPPLTRAWSRELGSQVSPPVIVDGKVFVIGGSDTEVRLHALDAVTGGDVWAPFYWSVAGERPTAPAGSSSPAATAGYGPSTPRPAGWSGTSGSAPTSSRAHLSNGRLFVDSSGAVQAVSATDGRLLGATPTGGGWGESSPAVTDTGVYVSYYAGESWAFDPATGAVRWHREPRNLAGGGRAPVIAGGRLWIREPSPWPPGSLDVALDSATGKVAGTYRSCDPPGSRRCTVVWPAPCWATTPRPASWCPRWFPARRSR